MPQRSSTSAHSPVARGVASSAERAGSAGSCQRRPLSAQEPLPGAVAAAAVSRYASTPPARLRCLPAFRRVRTSCGYRTRWGAAPSRSPRHPRRRHLRAGRRCASPVAAATRPSALTGDGEQRCAVTATTLVLTQLGGACTANSEPSRKAHHIQVLKNRAAELAFEGVKA